MVWLVGEKLGLARHGTAGQEWSGLEWSGSVARGMAGMERKGWDGRSTVGYGPLWQAWKRGAEVTR